MQERRFNIPCTCGFRIRGENHKNGPHHKRDNAVVTGARLARIERARSAKGRPTNVGDPSKK